MNFLSGFFSSEIRLIISIFPLIRFTHRHILVPQKYIVERVTSQQFFISLSGDDLSAAKLH